MGKTNTEHHRLPRSRCPQFGVDADDPRNTILKSQGKHRAYHQLLNNMTPEEAIKHLFAEWFPPISIFSPELIKNSHLRAFYEEFWADRINSRSELARLLCEKCGGRVIETGKVGKIRVSNCENCGDFMCFSCMLCMRPARIQVDAENSLYICLPCLKKASKKKFGIPRRYKNYKHVFVRLMRDINRKNEQITT